MMYLKYRVSTLIAAFMLGPLWFLHIKLLWRFISTICKSKEPVLHRESPCLYYRSYKTADFKILKTVGCGGVPSVDAIPVVKRLTPYSSLHVIFIVHRYLSRLLRIGRRPCLTSPQGGAGLGGVGRYAHATSPSGQMRARGPYKYKVKIHQ
jgi:hypothetical protein